MKQLVTLAATRPLVALGLGYVPFLALMGALVVIQSGWSQAAGIMAVNSALVLVPLACVWGAARFLGPDGGAWWKARLGAIVGGLAILCVAVLAGAWLLEGLYPGALPGLALSEDAPPPWLRKLGFAVFVALMQVVPLGLGMGVEAAARRLARAPTP